MLAKRIIPCLDIKDGRVVKGTSFVNLRDAGDPIELAKEYDRQGADEVVFLDITASSDKRGILLDLIKRCAKELFIPFTVGGGINDIQMIHDCLNAGADKVSINTAAVKNPTLIKEASSTFGSQCIVTAIDIKKIDHPTTFPSYPIKEVQCTADSTWEVFTHGGRNSTGIDAIKWIKMLERYGAGEILLTSMDTDGQKEGYDTAITSLAAKLTQIPIIASGGAGTLKHISDILSVADAALLASMLHYKETTVEEIKKHCLSKNITIRL
ncbi:imidazole glycerol phosphate synthase subunit HisF [Candidatus Marinamargulisbacteria bacterium SCGC AG-343-D04]|nr:imidazole glycerol phosphate synthase subunit HisF [Candidatus Marinamargulisbacteria bacterium SCGC AG-343-D04]